MILLYINKISSGAKRKPIFSSHAMLRLKPGPTRRDDKSQKRTR
jgi:hypothetical protein